MSVLQKKIKKTTDQFLFIIMGIDKIFLYYVFLEGTVCAMHKFQQVTSSLVASLVFDQGL